jgi:predicted DNA-binding transcriptional regulator AlpA
MRPDNFINKKQVGQIFGGVSKSTIDRWVQTGELPRPTKRFLMPRWNYEELMNWLRTKRSQKQFE